MRRLLPALLLLAACSGEAAPSTTAPSTTALPSPTTTATTTTTTTLPADRALVSIRVGDGIDYGPTAEDLPPVGPSLLTADPAGALHFYDPVGNQIFSFRDGEQTTIDLAARGILSVTALGSASDHLLAVEIFFGPIRQRVHRLEFDGEIRETIDLPAGYSLEDGLSGVLAGGGDEIIVEYGGGAYYGVWAAGADSFQTSPALSIGGTVIVSRPPDLVIGATTVDADLAGNLGSLRYLGTASDGTIGVMRIEVLATAPVIDVLTTVEWYTPEGGFLGSARVPDLTEQAIDAPPGVAMLPDGRIVAIVALREAVEIVELPRLSVRITGTTSSA